MPFLPPQQDESIAEAFRKNSASLSISGVQLKQSLVLDKKEVRLANECEKDQHFKANSPPRVFF
ncbi:MAG: hypothetical protein ACJA1Z_002238 [Patiriisocius sp.]